VSAASRQGLALDGLVLVNDSRSEREPWTPVLCRFRVGGSGSERAGAPAAADPVSTAAQDRQDAATARPIPRAACGATRVRACSRRKRFFRSRPFGGHFNLPMFLAQVQEVRGFNGAVSPRSVVTRWRLAPSPSADYLQTNREEPKEMSTSHNWVWRGAAHPPASGTAGWRADSDTELRALIEQGRPLLLIGFRKSSAAGLAGYASAVDDLLRAADLLAEVYGLDARPDLPTRDAMAAMLSTTPHAFCDGRRELRCSLIDLRGVGVVASLAAESPCQERGTHQSRESMTHLSWLDHLARTIRPLPAGLLTTRVDRTARSIGEVAFVHNMLDDLRYSTGAAWAASGDTGRWWLPSHPSVTHGDHQVSHFLRRSSVKSVARGERKAPERARPRQVAAVPTTQGGDE
jgi:hypothetical protein